MELTTFAGETGETRAEGIEQRARTKRRMALATAEAFQLRESEFLVISILASKTMILGP